MLTSSEIAFLLSQDLGPHDVYDARGQRVADWKACVRAAGLTVVLGNPCGNGGHRLRTRSGHCVQCDTSKLAYQKRHNTAAYVYIAGSRSARVVKIGTARDTAQRERNLRGQAYGGIDDWTMLFSVKVEAGGKIESVVLADLRRHAFVMEYAKEGRLQRAEEILRTGFTPAINAMLRALEGVKFDEPWRSAQWAEYEFKK